MLVDNRWISKLIGYIRAPYGTHTTKAEKLPMKMTGLSRSFAIRFTNWIGRAPPRVLWIILTIAINAACAAFAWFGVKDAPQVDFHENWVRALGATLQCTGVGLVAWGLRDTRRLFEGHGAPTPALSWWSERPRIRPRTHHLRAEPISGSFSLGRPTLTVHASALAPNASSEEKIAYLLTAVELLRKEGGQIRKEMVALNGATSEELKASIAAETLRLEGVVKEAKGLLVAHGTGGISLSLNGAIFLFVGVLLGTLPYSCF